MLDLNDSKTSNKRGCRFILVVIDNFSKNGWTVLQKSKNSQTIQNEFSRNLFYSKREPNKVGSDRAKKIEITVLQMFLKLKNKQHFSRYSHKGPSIAKRFRRTIRNLMKNTLISKKKRWSVIRNNYSIQAV